MLHLADQSQARGVPNHPPDPTLSRPSLVVLHLHPAPVSGAVRRRHMRGQLSEGVILKLIHHTRHRPTCPDPIPQGIIVMAGHISPRIRVTSHKARTTASAKSRIVFPTFHQHRLVSRRQMGPRQPPHQSQVRAHQRPRRPIEVGFIHILRPVSVRMHHTPQQGILRPFIHRLEIVRVRRPQWIHRPIVHHRHCPGDR